MVTSSVKAGCMLERAEYMVATESLPLSSTVKMHHCGQSAGKSWLTPQRLHACPLTVIQSSVTVNTKTMSLMFTFIGFTFNTIIILSRPVSISSGLFNSHHFVSMNVNMTCSANRDKATRIMSWCNTLFLITPTIIIKVMNDISWFRTKEALPVCHSKYLRLSSAEMPKFSFKFSFCFINWIIFQSVMSVRASLFEFFFVFQVVFSCIFFCIECHVYLHVTVYSSRILLVKGEDIVRPLWRHRGGHCFKANSTILNTLLTLSNERLYHEVGFAPQKAPLLSIFAASNETPQDKSLQAFDDRFLLRLLLNDCTEEDSFEALVNGSFGVASTSTLTLADIEQAQAESTMVTIPQDVIEKLKDIRCDLSVEGIRTSDRTIVKIAKLIRANAWMEGRTEVILEDLEVLIHALWKDPKHSKVVAKVVYQHANPLHLVAIETEDCARELHVTLNKDCTEDHIKSAIKQLDDMHIKLTEEVSLATDSGLIDNSSRATEALHNIAKWRKAAARLRFKMVGSRVSGRRS